VFNSANTRPFQLQVDLTAGLLAAQFMTLVLRAVESSTVDTLVPLSVRRCRITLFHAAPLRKRTMMLGLVVYVCADAVVVFNTPLRTGSRCAVSMSSS
jgi:hypothetical protein